MTEAETPSSPKGSPATGTSPLLVIVGPTAAGKSALAIELARYFGGEVVNYDSVQVYRGFDVGSGKVRAAERQGIPHHLLDVVEAGQVFTAGDYRRAAIAVLASLRERGRPPILVGGTGLYLRALLRGLADAPSRSEPLRRRLHGVVHRRGGPFLHRMLRRLDPATATRIHPNDTQKVLRAVEVCLVAREPMSRLLARDRSGHPGSMSDAGLPGFQAIKVGLNPDRAELHRRIEARVERMFVEGLVDEARALLRKAGLHAGRLEGQSRAPEPREDLTTGGTEDTEPMQLSSYAFSMASVVNGFSLGAESNVGAGMEPTIFKPLEALGYRQACALVRGETTMEAAVRDTQAAHRRYAKRQMTWFRREANVTWFPGLGDDPEVQRRVIQYLGGPLTAESSRQSTIESQSVRQRFSASVPDEQND